ncbi:unnamed protein product [Meloidogyne enterolobii]|uniref:Uncharacterized protein n=1 Tax=Meloidogyne enterolobii TaxID=390850 RepID=A0ACB0XXJ0_MELEN
MATPRHIYVIRHCEREDDVNRVWYFNSHFTRDNPPLSERGLVQANDLNREFKNIHIDYCFSSPYERCIQTSAKILEGRSNCLINVEPGFLEAGFLVRESGEKRPTYEKDKELAARYPNINLRYKPLYLSPAEEEFDSSATVRACFNRVKHTLKQLLKICEGDILIVTHQGPCAAIQEYFMDLLRRSDELLYPAQATVSKYVEVPGVYSSNEPPRFSDEYLCDCSHLTDRSGLKGKYFFKKR